MTLNSFSYSSKTGSFFKVNEDYIHYDLGLSLFSLMDGFGGASRGDVAAQFASEMVFNFYGKMSEDAESTKPFYFSSKYSLESNSLINAALYANKLLHEKNLDLPLGERSGSSALFLLINQQFVSILAIGNVRLTLLRSGELRHLIIPDRVEVNKQSQILIDFPMNGIGLDENMEFQFKEFPIQEGDLLLASTSGISLSCLDGFRGYTHKRGDGEKAMGFDFKSLFHNSEQEGNLNNQSAIFLDFT